MIEGNASVKIILSRKGFDSSPDSGGRPSPIFPDGTMVSLPIPDKSSPIKYGVIASPSPDFESLGLIVEQVTNGKFTRDSGAHLDPDIDSCAIERVSGWRPVFGQDGGFVTHLDNYGVA